MSKTPKVFETTGETYTRIGDQLGQGGAGRVFKVRDSAGLEHALKLMDPTNPASVAPKRFRNEIAACRAIGHPAVVKIDDDGFVVIDGRKAPFYVMPLYARDLRKEMNDGLSGDRALEILLQVLDGIEAAHLHNIWHRDLKPENILITKEGRAVVADFGIAHVTPEVAETYVQTKFGERLANFFYYAPEQRNRGSETSHLADIFSMGLILNEMFTNRVPHGTDYVTIGAIDERYTYLDPVVAGMTAQDPSSRYASIAQVKRDIAIRGDVQVRQQRLDETRKTVVASSGAQLVEPVLIVDVEPDLDALRFTFDRVIEPELAEFINSGHFSHQATMGSRPQQVQFTGQTASIPLQQAPEMVAQQVINNLKEWLVIGVRNVNSMREQAAREKEQRRRQDRKRQIEAEEKRLQLRKDLRW